MLKSEGLRTFHWEVGVIRCMGMDYVGIMYGICKRSWASNR
jgi:hypothetical protein